jgi:hypothetical protein
MVSVETHRVNVGGCAAMSALGQKQTCASQNGMSALSPKADMCGAAKDVRYGPIADSCTAPIDSLFNQLIGALLKRHWYG